MRLAGAAVRAAVEEGEELAAFGCWVGVVGTYACVRGGEVGGGEEVGLGLEGACDEDGVLRDDGEFVEDEEVVRVDGVDGERGRGVFEGVEGFLLRLA